MSVYYTFLAGWCAEAAGARLEFIKRKFTYEEAENALHMTEFNSPDIPEGQITDDSEMEIYLLSALHEGKDDEYFPIERIAAKYMEWFNTKPFDIGDTINSVLLSLESADDMLTNASVFSSKSESNGALMRCIPLAIFGMNRSTEILLNMASMESELTHPNKLVGEITGIYCVIIADILRNKNVNILSEVPNYIQNDKILQWFQLALKLENLETYDCVVNEGHVKHAFVFVIYFLRHIHEYTFERAIIEVLQCGGDTDTNAKIVGNLFGAFYGDCVPSYLSDAVLQFDCTTVESKFYKRPFQCSVKYAIELLQN